MFESYLPLILTAVQTFLLSVNQYLTNKGCLALAGIFVLLLILLKLKKPQKNKAVRLIKNSEEMQQTVNAIAGDDVFTTQLDLARAYIEMDQKTLAQEILAQVIQQGNTIQQHEAKLLMDLP